MEPLPKHSLYGYFTRLPTYKLELILDARYLTSSNPLLLPKDYAFIEKILRNRPDSRLFVQESD